MEGIVYDRGAIQSQSEYYFNNEWGRCGVDYDNAGFMVGSNDGALALSSSGGTISLNPTDNNDINIGAAAYNGAVSIATGGARTVTIGSANATTYLTGDALDFQGLVYENGTQTAANNAGDTLTGAQLWEKNPIFTLTPGGAVNLTLPTALQLVSACPRTAVVGDEVEFVVVNSATANAANAVTLVAGANMTTLGTLTMTPDTGVHGQSGVFRIRLTAVTGNCAAVVYRVNNSTN